MTKRPAGMTQPLRSRAIVASHEERREYVEFDLVRLVACKARDGLWRLVETVVSTTEDCRPDEGIMSLVVAGATQATEPIVCRLKDRGVTLDAIYSPRFDQ
jgi:hypothetical protein